MVLFLSHSYHPFSAKIEHKGGNEPAMAFFKWFKKPKEKKQELYESKLAMVNPKDNNQPLFQTGKYVEWVKLPLFEKIGSFQLKMIDIDNWESIFTTEKKNR